MVNRYSKSDRVYRLEFVSNSDYTDSEFNRWRQDCILDGITLPTATDLETKIKDIKEALDYKFNDEDVDQVPYYVTQLLCIEHFKCFYY